MRKPARFSSWEVWRHYHRTVWRVGLKRYWHNPVILAFYTLQVVFWETIGNFGPISRILLWCCALFVAVSWGIAMGRLYENFDQTMEQGIRWRKVQDDLRAVMLEDGMSPEQADQALWQMDIEVDRMQRRDDEP